MTGCDCMYCRQFRMAQEYPPAFEVPAGWLKLAAETQMVGIAPPPNIELRCKDDPEANGRTPKAGDQRYTLKFPLEDGRDLRIHMGREGHSTFTAMLAQMMVDDDEGRIESTPMDDVVGMAQELAELKPTPFGQGATSEGVVSLPEITQEMRDAEEGVLMIEDITEPEMRGLCITISKDLSIRETQLEACRTSLTAAQAQTGEGLLLIAKYMQRETELLAEVRRLEGELRNTEALLGTAKAACHMLESELHRTRQANLKPWADRKP